MPNEEEPRIGNRNVHELPDPYSIRRRDNETPEEHHARLKRDIADTEKTIKSLIPPLDLAETRMLELAKGLLKMKEEATPSNVIKMNDGKDFYGEKFATQERLAKSAQVTYEVIVKRMKEQQNKLARIISAFDALPDLDEAGN